MEDKKKNDEEVTLDEETIDEDNSEKETKESCDGGDSCCNDENSDEEVKEEAEEKSEAEEKNDKPEEGKFKKKKKEKKDKKDEKIEELTDRLMRSMAEFDNFRKRTDREKSQMYEVGAKEVIEKLLPVVDNFERGLGAIPEDEATKAFKDGILMIYKQLTAVLDEIGVKVIETEGKPFDPELHNAVMHIDDENLDENVIAEEFQKGYTYHDKVIRHSMVKVAN